ncbi:unnamed protein product [Zymoseptoria tritici ST99CH_1A5]|uniref:Uncharacterized protein n=2 Tax=Zymoseptoria tritici TaxID=1047171 RepID=A0A1X7S2D9_ZYMT9|nr:unnamed protein product [Zymoseptoria tritici ST99CH_3D7]SMR61261.1 unnamed protein product [Zymoseptoria tritici ST99CH_3D1]SMY27485.1 unnamed protein product [Zymoseptoria tritici ST99CH_1A5]
MDLDQVLGVVSWLCGWGYFTLWSLSYYPQPLLNFSRKSTEGLTFDYPVLNVLGSACYTISSATLLFSSTVRAQYADRHPASPEPTVRFNDFCYAMHSFLLCAVVFSQFWPGLWRWRNIWVSNDRTGKREMSRVTAVLITGSGMAVVASISFAVASAGLATDNAAHGITWEWIDVISTISTLKLVITVFKYAPQILSNHRRRSTRGFTIVGVVLDAGGGILSLVQLVVDCSRQADWSGLSGNPLKLGLAVLSLLADVVFVLQHFWLYRERGGVLGVAKESSAAKCSEVESSECDPLLA